MRSRSSRLFIVLLHLVGVSTHLPNNSIWTALFPNGPGIVGVQPITILLEALELKAGGGLNKLLRILDDAGFNVDDTILSESYWLQDDTDGKCLGPFGFSECGDVTLWRIRRRPVRSRRYSKKEGKKRKIKFMSSIFGPKNDDGPHGFTDFHHQEWQYALQLIDENNQSYNQTNKTEVINMKSSYPDKNSECMIVSADDGLSTGPCSSNKAWSWDISEEGVLNWYDENFSRDQKNSATIHEKGAISRIIFGGPITRMIQMITSERVSVQSKSSQNDLIEGQQTKNIGQSESLCVWRENASAVVTASCKCKHETGGSLSCAYDDNLPQSGRVLRSLASFSVIRYKASPATFPKLSLTNISMVESQSTNLTVLTKQQSNDLNQNKVNENDQIGDKAVTTNNIPKSSRLTVSQSKNPASLSSNVLFTNVGYYGSVQLESSQKKLEPFSKLESLNPSLVMGTTSHAIERRTGSLSSTMPLKNGKLLHPPSNTLSSGNVRGVDDGIPHRPRKMPVHPYIASSKNGLWEDKVTGLKYLTDLSGYLGHDKKVTGRHTLMGVGLYVKTMLKIKIYGVALYVAKRDVLADAGFDEFSTLPSDNLAHNKHFYDHLMKKPSPEGGNFDRTIFIKLNMQLTADTMRGSLEADWKLLSQEHRSMLANSSFKERIADARMISRIQSNENTSRCSCGQIAPAEYEADPSCCARGTELVFTWRKNGNLEVRLDGRLIDTFESPEMAQGIFHEYLRVDDPISPEARERFSDGFPFLLAPLAQLKGITTPISDEGTREEEKHHMKIRFPQNIGKMVENCLSGVTSQATEIVSTVHGNIDGFFSTVVRQAQGMSVVFERRRDETWEQFKSLPEFSTNFIASQVPFLRGIPIFNHVFQKKRRGANMKNIATEDVKHLQSLLSDEIGVIIEPTIDFTHSAFLTMVHFYLVLLLIVSVPGSATTKYVLKRSGASNIESEDSDSDDSSAEQHVESLRVRWADSPGRFPELHRRRPVQNRQMNSLSDADETREMPENHRKMRKALTFFL
mmetsp:Transcript_15365/g.21934  ORF Transcript_15365/g.21934 Transcript_15365/m.21934 type:complete len:1025 (+) Transcript_15365:291-3365(+)|eukprot:CAMPEP_0184855852 /NCGR_PEP_ID=MMETSP0580-20130426/991_1 /TAXON_ID=1118495 /ORGANISM="Dactyliosolen fragilissimus" /LENGTH=1024 /DNA_ID=CAMNT_0027350493 /DNA_START=244 /DNA_END=3318 /DNA_ORIENTATION=-